MKPGRELDALVAEKVMGCRPAWEKGEPRCTCNPDGPNHMSTWPSGGDELQNYSIDIAAAWPLLEKLKAPQVGQDAGSGKWLVWDGRQHLATATTAPHAICLAALRAHGALEEG